MSDDFQSRPRYTWEELEGLVGKDPDKKGYHGQKVFHVITNGDGTFSAMTHIVCEWCDYCEENDALGTTIHQAKEDPYEKMRAEEETWRPMEKAQ